MSRRIAVALVLGLVFAIGCAISAAAQTVFGPPGAVIGVLAGALFGLSVGQLMLLWALHR